MPASDLIRHSPLRIGDADRARLEELMATLEAFASLDFTRMAPVGSAQDEIDAIAAGVNMLGEEIEAAHAELESRVADRTLQLEDAVRRLREQGDALVSTIAERERAEAEARAAVTEMAAQAGQLRSMAFYDSLTGLANRVLLGDRLGQALARRPPRPVAVLLLDLDDFKAVNDISGHAAGDELLIEVAARLTAAVRPEDTVARLGGDEFAIVLEGTRDTTEVAKRVLHHLGGPFAIQGRQFVPGGTIGIAFDDDGTLPGEELLRRADVAMYAAKARRKGSFEHFEGDMAEALVARADMETGLRDALANGEFVVHYQPIIGVGAERVTRVEALVRWQRGDKLIPPAEFLPIAEAGGLIVALGHEVLEQACHQTQGWLQADRARSMAVNVSARQLKEPGFAESVLSVLEKAGVSPRQLVLEVTETLFLEAHGRVIDHLVTLRQHGAKVALDDFGTGFSSLGRLQALPVDSAKVDRTFVKDIRTGREDLPILSSMIVMAHSLGLDVTAEGVETPKQAERLVALGCEYLQGFHFARPCAIDEVAASSAGADATMQRLGFRNDVGERPIVLVLDDDPVTRSVVRASLAESGLEVHEAASIAEARELAARIQPDCFLVDLVLPDGDGVELISELRAADRHSAAAIVVFTAAANRDTKMLAFTSGADDYVVKPLVGKHLASRLRGAMRAAPLQPR